MNSAAAWFASLCLLQDPGSRSTAPRPATATTAALTRLHTGFQFTEGPAADVDGTLYFSDVHAHRIWRVDLDGKLALFLEDSKGCNGLMCDGTGRLLACQGEAKRLIAIDLKTKAIEVLTDNYDGKPFNRPNDLVVDRAGGVYFSDPLFGRGQATQDVMGVYYVAPDRTVTRVIADMSRPNGVLLSPDEKTLYLLSGHEQLMAWPDEAPGLLGKRRDFCRLVRARIQVPPGSSHVTQTGSSGDGLAADVDGNLFLAVPPAGVIQVVNPAGQTIETIPVPEAPTNCDFGGRGHCTLFVTAQTSLYAMPRAVAGHRFGVARPASRPGR
jgi:gluconolactonase